ncbi:MAG: hypothetical protein SGARI_001631 [Bacillariaceae sp.]
MKNLHAAVSKQSGLVNIDTVNLEKLRNDIKERISEVFEILTRVIGFGFHCHHPDTAEAGMSTALLSVNLAVLMAVFRSRDLATMINVDDLTILIKEAGTGLLDKRLASSSSTPSKTKPLAEETSSQMVRAINKLAVQAAVGAKRENAIQALFRLQEQISLNATAGDDPQFNSRLSRVVTKLMTRIIKAEESVKIGDNVPAPFDSSSMDMETIICCLDDSLTASYRAENDDNIEGATAVREMAKLVLVSILKARGESSTFCQMMTDIGIVPESSELGKLVSSCCADLGISSFAGSIAPAPEAPDIASLVSAVGSATDASDRDHAVTALKEYKSLHGDTELNRHLENVSGTFRDFLVEQLAEKPEPPSPKATSNSAMTERLKLFRSKLGPKDGPAPAAASILATSSTRQAQVTRTDLSETAPKSTANAFRDRLAAANEKRADLASSTNSSVLSPTPAGDAGSRAAALRARLEAVRKQSNLPEGGK